MTLLTRLEATFPIYFLNLTLKATVILLLAALAIWVLRRSSAALRHAIVTAALLSTIALPLLSRGLPRLEVPLFTEFFRPVVQAETDQIRTSPESLSKPAADSDISSQSLQNESIADASMASVSNSKSAVVTSTSTLRGRLASAGLVVWIFGALSVLLTINIGEIRTLRLRFASSRLQNSEWNRSLSEVTRQHGMVRRVILLENSTISVPMTCGTIRPAILIPAGFNSSSAECRRILQHEIAHVIRFDVGLQTLGRLVCAFYWFHPLAWWCLRQMHREREQACDDWVLRSGERRTEYADQLLAIAKKELAPRPLSSAVGFVRNGNLEKRVHAILNDDCSHAAMGRVRGALLIAVSVCICVTVAIIHPGPSMAADPADQTGGSKQESSEPVVELNSVPTKTDTYTVPINVTGLALDTNGEPIPGATIYLSSQREHGKKKPIGKTNTDDQGRYTFKNFNLPIKRSGAKSGRDNGSFILYGTAKGHGFTWSPRKSFLPNGKPNSANQADANRNPPSAYDGEDKIELNLKFHETSTIRGTVVSGDGVPIANTKLALWDVEEIPEGGYRPGRFGVMNSVINSKGNSGWFELLNANVPREIWICHTDNEGQFVFTDVPKNRRFRVKVRPPKLPNRIVWISTKTGMKEHYDGYRLYDVSKEIRLKFRATVEVPIRVVYSDTGKPAPDVYVGGSSKLASTFKTTDKDGRVSLALPPGEFTLSILPAYGTPYLEDRSNFTVDSKSPSITLDAKLPAAGQVKILVVDKDTGKGIEDVDLWRETTRQGRELHYTTSYEVATRIVHRDRERTDKNGIINAIFSPGKHRIGVALKSFPEDYRPVEKNGIEIECEAGKKDKVVFHLERASKD